MYHRGTWGNSRRKKKGFKMNEAELRLEIAKEIEFKMMPLCVCARCDNLLEGAMVQKAIDIVLGDFKASKDLTA